MTGAELAEGLSFGLPDDLITAFAVFGITGVGAAELIFYPIWCLEKGYARATGPRDDSPEWYERARGWMRVMKYDAWFSMAIYTVGTLSFYVLGAAILHRRGATVGNEGAIDTLASMYVHTIGPSGLWIFYLGAFMVLYSTLFVSSASNARLFADIGGLAGVFRYRTPEDRMRDRALCRHWDSDRRHARLPAFRVARDARADRRRRAGDDAAVPCRRRRLFPPSPHTARPSFQRRGHGLAVDRVHRHERPRRVSSLATDVMRITTINGVDTVRGFQGPKVRRLLLLPSIIAVCAVTVTAQAPPYFPERFDWQRRTPAEAGFDSAALAEAIKFAIANENPGPRDPVIAHARHSARPSRSTRSSVRSRNAVR